MGGNIVCSVELLERDRALAALAQAHAAAARGNGRAVLVSGEPGIGKTALVSRFTSGLDARVLWGACDDLSIPRPLAPFHDMAGIASLATGAAPHQVQALLIAELAAPPGPTVVVLEDLHWADDATIDVVTVLGRRVGGLPALLVLTFRGGEVPPGHPLHAALGAIGAGSSAFVELAPLSRGAVASLAGDDGDELYAVTGGNPFYVTELLAARPAAGLPPSVAGAVLGRAARLDDMEQRLVELVSVVPNRIGTRVLDAAMPDWSAAAEQPERRGLLEVGPGHVRFRHEIARHAIRSNVPIARRRRLHAEILKALLAVDADPADIVHHAEAAGDDDVVADYAPVAARRAAALDSNREAYSHFARAADVRGPAPARRSGRAVRGVRAGRLRGQPPRGGVSGHGAEHRDLPRCRRRGRSSGAARGSSRASTGMPETATARRTARAAVAILEPEGESAELARAYSGLSQLAMLAEHGEEAIAWGERALALATRLGDEPTRAHALINVGSARSSKTIPMTAPPCSRRTRSRTPPATATRRRAR